MSAPTLQPQEVGSEFLTLCRRLRDAKDARDDATLAHRQARDHLNARELQVDAAQRALSEFTAKHLGDEA